MLTTNVYIIQHYMRCTHSTASGVSCSFKASCRLYYENIQLPASGSSQVEMQFGFLRNNVWLSSTIYNYTC